MQTDQSRHVLRHSLRWVVTITVIGLTAGCHTLTPFGGNTSPKSQLVSTYWQLTRVAGHRVATNKDTRTPYILLTAAKQKLQGYAGCNNIRGSFERDDQNLKITLIAQTKMLCQDQMQLENALTTALGKTRHIRIRSHSLVLRSADGQTLARFRARLKQYDAE